MSFFARSNTHRPESLFSDLYNEDFVLAARHVGRHQLARLDTSPYQRELLARGLDRWARGERPDRRMEQGMGYSAAIGTVLMDKLAGVCERNKERFTGVRTDLGKVECQSVFFWSPFSTLFSPTSHSFHLHLPPSRLMPTSKSRKDNVFHC